MKKRNRYPDRKLIARVACIVILLAALGIVATLIAMCGANMKNLLMKTLTKLLIASLILAIASVLIQTPIMTNEVALAQMDASDVSFMAWSLYRPTMTIIRIILCIISGGILSTVAMDIHNYINKNEKE